MAAKPQKDLIGRPLVPFFTDEGHVNDSLHISRDMEHEHMEVDARVWNAAQGYFEYPDENPKQNLSSTPPTQKPGGLLLTPQRLETSVRSQSREKRPPNIPTLPTTTTTPVAASPEQPGARLHSITPVDVVYVPASASKKKGKKTSPNNDKQTKSNKGKNSAETKWAWSAFQNSPDPKSLPLPPFLSPQLVSQEPEPTPAMTQLTLNVEKKPPPSKPPNPPHVKTTLQPSQVTILKRPKQAASKPSPPKPNEEEQMTMHLRKMLNIGGGGQAS
ncbi:Aste57867_23578 [Aphanomyces stellatus]|uniref:Aste57867_23578 protein n=1 Tax=Aphanomyces stellatus TaxID=120398 RepID=A0A485LPX9_9STRA|nr:hypothetical protein As57867_023507 [Aphanomyces stellatus]VFU00223.1 Aste57867_23578 [Aphanomyces stellatus]